MVVNGEDLATGAKVSEEEYWPTTDCAYIIPCQSFESIAEPVSPDVALISDGANDFRCH